jgi:hypothetical protein
MIEVLDVVGAAQALYRGLGVVQIPRYRNDEMVDTMCFEGSLKPPTQ